ncbi:hypothetical protein HAX54_037024 [Datura stramonium]|uniref:Uncharacterized protein n=1 Tax=Datura stramonium TaxID=4076 RepID=A0ABS8VHP4_DATST|nr:hypothetical protein [Datura stramonium]
MREPCWTGESSIQKHEPPLQVTRGQKAGTLSIYQRTHWRTAVAETCTAVGDDDIQLFSGGVRQNADGTPFQGIVRFRPLSGSRVASVICRLVPATRRLVIGSPWICSVFCLTSASHRRFADSSCDSSVFRRCC